MKAERERVTELINLFDSLRSQEASPARSCSYNEVYMSDSRHRKQIIAMAEEAGESYLDDGEPLIFAFLGAGSTKVCGYRWADPSLLIDNGGTNSSSGSSLSDYETQNSALKTNIIKWSSRYKKIDWAKARGVIIHSHGITECARTCLLRCRATTQALGDLDHLHTEVLTQDEQTLIREKVEKENGYYVTYDKSWVQAITQAGFVLYSLDHQGHGYSQGWKGERCNVERLSNLHWDLIELTRNLVLSGEVPQCTGSIDIPIFLSGLSLGGLVTLRALQIAFSEKILSTPQHPLPNCPRITGVCLFCPAISGERLKKKFPNQFLLPITRILSIITPSARMVALEDTRPYDFLNPMIARDAMVYKEKLPIRISAESVAEMDKILPNSDYISADLSILLIQSRNDTMTDPEGSAKFMETIKCTDKKVHWLNYSWHWLSREPGYGATCQIITDWLVDRGRKLE